MQASLGWALPTLVLWRTQVEAAQLWAANPERCGDTQQAQAQLEESQYGRLCRPMLQAADASLGGAACCMALLALAGFMAAHTVQALRLP